VCAHALGRCSNGVAQAVAGVVLEPFGGSAAPVHMAVAAAILQVFDSKSLCSGYGMGCVVLGHAAVLYIADGEGVQQARRLSGLTESSGCSA
jgi:hypothetical protein